MFRRLKTKLAWWILARSAHHWATHHMDQFETFKYQTSYGPIYVKIALEVQYPDGYEVVDKNGNSVL